MNGNSRWSLPELTGRTAIVTGANSGLGLEIATSLAGAGADVVLACRNKTKADTALASIRRVHPDAAVEQRRLDLASLASVQEFAESYRADHERLDLLVNNAGVMAVDRGRTEDGFETHLGVNHLGHFALTQRLAPLLLATEESRVGTMSSVFHRPGRIAFDDLMSEGGYRRWRAYAQSKLANMLFTLSLAKRLQGSNSRAVAAHPGASRTHLGHDGTSLANRVWPFVQAMSTQPASLGALPLLRALTDPAAASGRYYGPRFVAFGWPVVERPARRALDAAAAERLWQVSAELTGLDAFV